MVDLDRFGPLIVVKDYGDISPFDFQRLGTRTDRQALFQALARSLRKFEDAGVFMQDLSSNNIRCKGKVDSGPGGKAVVHFFDLQYVVFNCKSLVVGRSYLETLSDLFV